MKPARHNAAGGAIWAGHRLARPEERYSSQRGRSAKRPLRLLFRTLPCPLGWRRLHLAGVTVPAIVHAPFDDVPPRIVADVRMPRLLATAQVRRAREQRSTRERQ